jgi:hypothetical protein
MGTFKNTFAAWISSVEGRLSTAHDQIKWAGRAELGRCYLASDCKTDNIVDMGRYADWQITRSTQFFDGPRVEFCFTNGRLEFQSPMRSKSAQNDTVIGELHSARSRKRAVILLGHWNARRPQYGGLARSLARLGISCLQLSLPYHDERETPGVGYAREMASENLGLTIQAHRQAVIEARIAIGCLQELGFEKIGLIGSSLGSSIASIASAHDHRVGALSLVLMADDLTDVVWTSTATRHIRASLEVSFTREEVKRVWSVVSPNSYVKLLSAKRLPTQIFSGVYDQVFQPELTELDPENETSS